MEKKKRCYTCKKSKLISDFCKNKYNKDGFHTHCKECKYLQDLYYIKKKSILNKKAKIKRVNNEIKLLESELPLLESDPNKLYEKIIKQLDEISYNTDTNKEK